MIVIGHLLEYNKKQINIKYDFVFESKILLALNDNNCLKFDYTFSIKY